MTTPMNIYEHQLLKPILIIIIISFYSECSWHYSSTREPELMKCSHGTAPLQEMVETGSQHRVTATCFTSLTLSWISSSGVHVPSRLAPI